MTTKTAPKTAEDQTRKTGPTPEELVAAYKAHTLLTLMHPEIAYSTTWAMKGFERDNPFANQVIPPIPGVDDKGGASMFWNDPNLYGATFPYKDITTPVQPPFMGTAYPWLQNIPKYVPPFYGFTPYYNIPQQFFPPYFNQMQTPFFNQMTTPYFPQVPQHLPYTFFKPTF